ncbi:MAG: acyl-CoA dehydrogenase family protein [Actinomycetota bacterium]
MSVPTLDDARTAVSTMQQVVDAALDRLAAVGVDDHQVVAYDIAHGAAAVASAANLLTYGDHGETETRLTVAFVADVAHDLATRVLGRETTWGVERGALDAIHDFMAAGRSPELLASLVDGAPAHLDDDMQLAAETFRRFADEQIAPHAEHVHRTNANVPEELISGLAELGVFGLSAPVEYGGYAEGGIHDYLGMVVATEELSRGSLGIGGSLITRPEILTRALVAGGTEGQKTEWLPKLASGEVMAAVAVTEPDYGSDVAGIRVAATPAADGGWVINGVKTWCTFAGRADVLMLLARTEPGSTDHKGLSVFIVPKPRGDGHSFEHRQDGGGVMTGRAIDTLGYRGMHSYEVALENWWVPVDALIGEAAGRGRGFYYQMEGFENGRLQTAARAVGVMQAAYEAAKGYADDRIVFGSPIADYQLTQAKLGRMAVIIQAARQLSLHVAELMAKGEGMLEASMTKAYVCRAAEWVTREAMQIHGGMGYAEEYSVSRYYVDARVLSIFEGADETLALKVIIRRLLAERSS